LQAQKVSLVTLLPRVFFLPGISREVRLLLGSRADASTTARGRSFVGMFGRRVVFAEESDVGLERICKTYPLLMCFRVFLLGYVLPSVISSTGMPEGGIISDTSLAF